MPINQPTRTYLTRSVTSDGPGSFQKNRTATTRKKPSFQHKVGENSAIPVALSASRDNVELGEGKDVKESSRKLVVVGKPKIEKKECGSLTKTPRLASSLLNLSNIGESTEAKKVTPRSIPKKDGSNSDTIGLRNIEKEYEQLQKKYRQARSELNEKEQAFIQIRQQLLVLHDKLTEFHGQEKQFSADIKELEEYILQKNVSVPTLKTICPSLTSLLSEIQNMWEEVFEKQVVETPETEESTKTNVQAIKQGPGTMFIKEKLEEVLVIFQTRERELTEDNNTLEKKVGALEDIKTSLETVNKKLEQENTELKDLLTNHKLKITTTTAELEAKDITLEQLRQECNNLKDLLASDKLIITKTSEALDEKNIILELQRNELEHLKAAKESLAKDLERSEDSQLELDRLKEIYNELKVTNEALTKRLTVLEEGEIALECLKQEYHDLKVTNEVLTKKFTENEVQFEEENCKLKSALEGAKIKDNDNKPNEGKMGWPRKEGHGGLANQEAGVTDKLKMALCENELLKSKGQGVNEGGTGDFEDATACVVHDKITPEYKPAQTESLSNEKLVSRLKEKVRTLRKELRDNEKEVIKKTQTLVDWEEDLKTREDRLERMSDINNLKDQLVRILKDRERRRANPTGSTYESLSRTLIRYQKEVRRLKAETKLLRKQEHRYQMARVAMEEDMADLQRQLRAHRTLPKSPRLPRSPRTPKSSRSPK